MRSETQQQSPLPAARPLNLLECPGRWGRWQASWVANTRRLKDVGFYTVGCWDGAESEDQGAEVILSPLHIHLGYMRQTLSGSLVLENKGKSWHSSSCHPSKPSGVLRALASLLPPCTQEGPSLSFSAFPGQLMSLPLPPETRALRAPKAAV